MMWGLGTRRAAAALAVALIGSVAIPAPVNGQSYERITGGGSSWAGPAIDAARANVAQFGIVVDYARTASSEGRKDYLADRLDFAASDIPFQFHPEDGSEPDNPKENSYAYIPVTAGGTSFMYNLTLNGQRVTNLRLSGENVAKIFTGVITMWNDPAIQADNPGLALPARAVVPVVRADGSGSTAQFTQWMIDRHPAIWNDYCQRSGRAPACGFTSYYPTIPGMIGAATDSGVASYIREKHAEGAIGYTNYSYPFEMGFPVAKVLNAAGYYTEPTPANVAVSLLQAKINMDSSNPAVYLTQNLDGVYRDADPRNYQLSSYSYFILRTTTTEGFNQDKGRTLGAFAYYMMCQAQQQSEALGYSPMPINLVQASFEQIRKVPGVEVQNIDVQSCNNPTFSPDGTNVLARDAPMPQDCDRQGATQCADGTGGMRTPTPTNNPSPSGGGGQQPGGEQGGGQQSGAQQDGGQQGGGQQGGGQQQIGAGNQPEVSQGGGATATTAPCVAAATTTTTLPGSVDTAGASTTSSTTTTVTSTTVASDDATPTTTSTTLPPCDPHDGVSVQQSGGLPSGPDVAVVGVACDPDTGECGAAAADGEVAAAANPAGGPAVGAIVPTVLAKPTGWGTTQTLIVVVSLLTIGLVLAPALLWRHLSSKADAT